MDKTVKPYLFFVATMASIAGLYLYRPFNLYFLADDFLHIPESAKNIWLQRNSLRPIGNISLHIDNLFSQKNALGYHVTNLLLHVANTWLVFIFSKLLLTKYTFEKTTFLPILISIFFFTYPFHSEAVFWIIGRSGSLGCLFFLAAMIGFLKKEESLFFSIFSLVCFELALLSYESSWIFPLVILFFIVADGTVQLIKKHTGYLLFVVLLFSVHLFIRFSSTGELMNQYDAASFVQLNFHVLIENYIRLFARTMTPPLFNNHHFLLVFSVVIVVLALLVFVLYRKGKLNRFFLAITATWLCSYIPYLSIGIDTHGVEGERYLYLPSVFFSIWILYLLHQLFAAKQLLLITISIVAVHIFYVQQSRTYYVKAGAITAITIHQLNALNNNEKVFFQNLPQYNKGAVVFRTGLEDAVKWLGINQPQIIIVSKDNSDEQPRLKHHTTFNINYGNNNMPIAFTTILMQDRSFKKNYVVKDTVGLKFNPATDALFVYNDTSLNITR